MRLPWGGLTVLLALAAAVAAHSDNPEVTAKAALLMDAESGTLLFSKNPYALRQPASTTKMMTGLLALERIRPGTMITAPLDIDKVGESSLHLKPAETLTREDAVFALLLRSANDMAHALAVHMAGSDSAFARMMNERAAEIGCKHTTFRNPHGLPDDEHLTCAYDLALIAREAMKNDFFRKIVGTQKWFVMRSTNQKDLLVKNTNKLLWEDDKVEGVKTGYTRAAGQCFVGYRSEEGTRLISVVLGSDDWVADTKALFDFGFKQLSLQARYAKEQIVGNVHIEGAATPSIAVRVADPVAIFSPIGSARPQIMCAKTSAPVQAGEPAGFLRFVSPSGDMSEVPLLFAESRARQSMLMSLAGSWLTWVGLGVCGLCVAAFRGRTRRKGHRAR